LYGWWLYFKDGSRRRVAERKRRLIRIKGPGVSLDVGDRGSSEVSWPDIQGKPRGY